jgi:hypothetical protein
MSKQQTDNCLSPQEFQRIFPNYYGMMRRMVLTIKTILNIGFRLPKILSMIKIMDFHNLRLI